ncbi:nuclear hormone receptor FTZ-F1 beta-like [Amphiura filiformis]|uniref:nuclear hormone receptor FTZ-F1 beta-like n=1 Tax=Amphiura filiformis TaxID=82378 RepID=UPI003B21D893
MGIPQKQIQSQLSPMLREFIKAEDELINQDGLMECCREAFDAKELDLFSAVCHLMDHQLYTFVKWARTLPLYKDLKTEDQIVLMQRRGLHLMSLTVCYYFINDENLISLPNGQKVVISNIKDENVADIVQGLVDTAGRLRHLNLDKHELVCLKGIMLLNPVSKGLIDVKRVQEMQETMEDLLIDYVDSQPHIDEKVTGELLLRLSEIERLCQLTREEVIMRKSQGRLGRYPLLMELFEDKPSWLY